MAEIASFGVNVDQNTRLAQNAQDTADDANAKNSANSQQIANINDPNYLSPFEKPQLQVQMDNFATLYTADKDIATSESIDFTAYEAAYQAYVAYMTPLVADISTYSPIDRDTFNSMVTAVQAEQKRFSTATQAQYNQQIKQAQTDIDDGQTKYQALQSDAETMKSSVAGVADTASRAISSAGFASDAASAASQAASSAVASAMSAESNAASAVSKAESTASEFGPVKQKADSAVATANDAAAGVTVAKSDAANALTSAATAFNATATAQSTADNAFSKAQEVGSQASAEIAVQSNATATAQSTADNAFSKAQEVGSQASAEISSNSTATATAQSTADNAFSKATTAIDNGKVTSQAVTNLKDGSKLTIAELENGLATKVANSDYASYKEQTASQIASKVDNSAFSAYQTQTADLISSKVANKDFTAYQATTAKSIDSKVDNGDFSTYKTQTDKDIASKVSSGDFESYKTQTADAISSKVSQDTYNTLAGTVDQVSTLSKQNQSELVTKADSQAVDTLKQRVTTAENTLTQTATKTELQQTETDVDKLNDSVNTNTTDITAQAGKIDGLLSSTTDINGKLTTLQGSFDLSSQQLSATMSTVDGQTTSINDLQADSSGFKAQFQTVNDTIGKNTTDIGTLQATSKELSSNFNSLNTDNTTNKNDISQLKLTATEVSSTLETVKTQVQNSAVGTNLLLNTGDFSGNWSLNGILDTSQKPAVSHYPMKSLTSGTNVIANQQLNNGLLQPSTTYTASFYAKGTGTFIFYCYPSVANGEHSDAHTNIKLTSDYKLYTITFTTIPDISGDKNFLLRQDYSPSETDQNTVEAYVYGFKLEKGSLATDWSANPADNATVTAVSKISQTADGAQVLATNNKGDITSLQETAKGLQSTVKDKVSSSQLTQLSGQLTNEIKKLSSSTSSKFTQTSNDINGLVKKGDVVNQLNIDAGGILLDTSGSTAKIILSSNNIELDSANPVVMGSANITNLLTSKTIEASSITSTTKIIGSDIQAAMIHSTDNSFVLDGDKGSIMGATITSTDNSWSISPTGKITGADVYAGGTYTYVASGSGNTVTGAIYNELNSNGYHQWTDANDHVRINNGTIGITNDEHEKANIDSVDGIPLGVLISDGQSQFTGNVSITNNLQVGNLYTNGYHTINSMDGGAVFLENGVNSGNDMVDFHAGVVFTGGLHTNNLSMNNGHTIASADGGGIYVEDTYNSGGNMVDLHVKKLYQSSLLSLKTDIKPIDPHKALTEVVKNDVMGYHFKNDKTTDPKSVSVILDDINPIPKYYTSDVFKSADGAGRNDGNIVGYLMLSIKDLNNRLQKLEGAN